MVTSGTTGIANKFAGIETRPTLAPIARRTGAVITEALTVTETATMRTRVMRARENRSDEWEMFQRLIAHELMRGAMMMIPDAALTDNAKPHVMAR